MPAPNLTDRLDFANQLTQGLEAPETERTASLQKEAVLEATAERLADFTKIGDGRFAFTPVQPEKLGSYPFDTGGVWKMVDAGGQKLLVREDRYQELEQAGVLTATLQKAASLTRTAGFAVGDYVTDEEDKGNVTAVNPDGTVSVQWLSGRVSTEQPGDVRRVSLREETGHLSSLLAPRTSALGVVEAAPIPQFSTGQSVQAMHPDTGQDAHGQIVKVDRGDIGGAGVEEIVYTIRFDDGEEDFFPEGDIRLGSLQHQAGDWPKPGERVTVEGRPGTVTGTAMSVPGDEQRGDKTNYYLPVKFDDGPESSISTDVRKITRASLEQEARLSWDTPPGTRVEITGEDDQGDRSVVGKQGTLESASEGAGVGLMFEVKVDGRRNTTFFKGKDLKKISSLEQEAMNVSLPMDHLSPSAMRSLVNKLRDKQTTRELSQPEAEALARLEEYLREKGDSD